MESWDFSTSCPAADATRRLRSWFRLRLPLRSAHTARATGVMRMHADRLQRGLRLQDRPTQWIRGLETHLIHPLHQAIGVAQMPFHRLADLGGLFP